MSNINFLPTKDKRDAHKKSGKKENIKWSKPAKGKTAEDKEKSSGWFSLLRKNSTKDGKLKEDRFDKNNFKRSRQEVLQLIKEYAKDQDSNKKPRVRTKIKKEFNPLAWLSKLRKPKDDKGVLVDYQQDFKEKQKTKNRKQPAPLRFAGPGKAESSPPAQTGKQPACADRKTESMPAFTASAAPASATPFATPFAKVMDVKKVLVGEQQMAEKLADDKKKKKKKKKAEFIPAVSTGINVDKEKKWENPDILETNLIKGEIIFFFNWRKGIIKLSIAIILACLAIGVVYGGLDFWQKYKEEEIRKIAQKFIELNQQIRQAEQGVDEILAWQRKLSLVSTLLDNHIYWTNFFKFLENNTLVDVYFPGGFSGDTSGNYNLAAVGVNYNTIHQQVKTLKILDQVVRVGVTSGSFTPTGEDGQSSINFSLELSVNPEIFYKE